MLLKLSNTSSTNTISTNIEKPTGQIKVKKISNQSKSKSTRDVLSNITNLKKTTELPVSKKPSLPKESVGNKTSSIPNKESTGNVTAKSGKKSSKKSSMSLAGKEEENGRKKEHVKLKSQQSDPMIIDEEDQPMPSISSMSVSPVVQYEDIDIHDHNDPQAVAQYVNEIYEYLMEKEKEMVDPNYISRQVDINERMRSILVDWIVEVHRMFKLLPETLFLAIALIDRYLSITQISRDKLQLVGITSMLIASKYEEIYAPECNDFVYISDGAYTKQQILKMEQTLLNTLNFNITHPSALHFLRRYSKAAGSDYTLHTLCKYLIEMMLLEAKLLKFPPSLIAASSVYLGRAMTQKLPLWTGTLEHYSTYDESKVRACAEEMNEFLKRVNKSSLKAIKKKYSSPKFGQVSEIPLVDL